MTWQKKQRLREIEKKDVKEQCERYLLECGEVKTYKMTPDELAKYKEKLLKRKERKIT